MEHFGLSIRPDRQLMSANDKDIVVNLSRGFFPNDERETDFTIKAGPYKWRVHRDRLSLSSRFFDRACNGGFKEERDNLVDLVDEDPLTVARMIQFLYFDRFDVALDCTAAAEPVPLRQLLGQLDFNTWLLGMEDLQEGPLIANARVYAFADKYDIPRLKTESRARFSHLNWFSDFVDFGKFLQIVEGPLWDNDGEFRRMIGENIGVNFRNFHKNHAVVGLLKSDHEFCHTVLWASQVNNLREIELLRDKLKDARGW